VPRSPSPHRPAASLGSYTDGSSLTIWGYDGIGYTIVPSRSEIYATDGNVFELDASELADAMTAFLAAYEGDRAVNSLASAPPPNIDCRVLIDGCPPEYAYSVPGAGPAPIPGDGGVPLPPPPASGFVVRRADPTTAATLPSLPAADFDAADLQYVGCSDIAGAIYDATARHRTSRDAVINVLKGALVLRAAVAYETGLKISLGSIQGLSFKLELAAHEQLTSTTQLNILATLYSAYGCWGGAWGTPGSVGGTYFPPVSPVYKTCHTEVWDVSADGGRTWSSRAVQVCEYYMD
jgi:hypothetical protein